MKTLTSFTISLFFLLMLLPLQPVSAAQIQVSVDRNPVSLNESFQITFTASETPDDSPDFSPLEQDFDILSQTKNSKSSWINGKSSKTLQWVLNVMAKRNGSMIIPAVKFGADSSQAMPIQVIAPLDKQDSRVDSDLFLEVEAVPEKPYVQAQVLYTLRLYRRVEITQASLSEPELADAVIEKLGDDSNFTTQIKGVDYWVTERKYAIFPQKSGQMSIKPLQLTAQVVTSSRPSFSGFFNPQMTQTRRVSSKPITLEVQPAPASYNGQHWLAAEQVYMNEEWSGDRKQMKVGEPLTRTLTLLAKGTTVSQLPELNTGKTDAQLKSYPDQPVLQEQKKADGVIAFREEKIAIIPSKAGSYTLPAIELPWFNTKTRKMEIARIPETSLTAVAAAGAQLTPSTPAAPIAVQAQKTQAMPVTPSPQYNIWLWVSLFLGLGWLLTLIYFLSRRRPSSKPVIEDNAVRMRLEDCVKKLKKACHEDDAAAAKDALIAWAQQKYIARDGVYAASQSGTGAAIARDGVYAASQSGTGAAIARDGVTTASQSGTGAAIAREGVTTASQSGTGAMTSLAAIAARSDARLRDEILHLNQVLYGREAEPWQGKKLFQAFVENKAREKIRVTEDRSLEPLYRL